MYMKLDPVLNIFAKFDQDRDKIDNVIKYFMRPPPVVRLRGRDSLPATRNMRYLCNYESNSLQILNITCKLIPVDVSWISTETNYDIVR